MSKIYDPENELTKSSHCKKPKPAPFFFFFGEGGAFFSEVNV